MASSHGGWDPNLVQHAWFRLAWVSPRMHHAAEKCMSASPTMVQRFHPLASG